MLNELFRMYESNSAFKQQLDSFSYQMEQPTFKFFKDVLLTLKGKLLTEMLSRAFSILPAEEKNIAQLTYYNLNQWLDFFLNPVGTIKQKEGRLLNLVEKTNLTRGKVKPNPDGKE
ncbi:MAG: hypothetical protein A2W01_11250 [Candidatus Solincola sediminis]|nr:MAG: hypothetical protein A2W01_11250 [Candidatus Solincola sediminis]